MNFLRVAFVLTPLAVISLFIYLYQSDLMRTDIELEKANQKLERMQFDSEFDVFWESNQLDRNDLIEKQKAIISNLESKRTEKETKINELNDSLSSELDNQKTTTPIINLKD